MSVSLVYTILYKTCEKFYIPTVFVDLIIVAILVLDIILSILNVENSREMQTDVTWDHLIAYNNMMHPYRNLVQERKYVETGENYGRGVRMTIIQSIESSKLHWSMIIGGLIIWGIAVAIIIFSNIRSVLLELLPRKKNKLYQWADIVEIRIPKIQQVNIKYGNSVLIKPRILTQQTIATLQLMCLLIVILTVILFIRLMPGNVMQNYVPWWYIALKSLCKAHYDNEYITNATNIYHDQLQQFNRYNISSKYPLVHGNLNQWCSYNKNECEQKYKFHQKLINQNINNSFKSTNINSKQFNQISNKPNIINIFYESFSPGPQYLNQQLFKQNFHDWIEEQPYSIDIFPDISKLANKSINFIGLTTNSLPTIQAWPSLISTNKVNLYKLNMIQEVNQTIESYLTILKKYGWHTTYLSPAPGDFDGKYMWYWNADIFDQIHYYAPTTLQLKDMNVYIPLESSWVDDKILFRESALAYAINLIQSKRSTIQKASQEYCNMINEDSEYKMKYENCYDIMRRKQLETMLNLDNKLPQEGQPLQFALLTMNTHTPFKGVASEEYGWYNLSIKSNYPRQLQYSQKQISQFLNFALKLDQNTIFTINGDHGARLPYKDESNLPQFQSQCKHMTSGNDEMFTVSGIIGFGENVIYDKQLQKYFGKTFIKQFDYDDMLNLLFQELNITLPTTRTSYFSKIDIQNDRWWKIAQQKLSVSATHNIIEVRKNNNILRSSLFSPDNSILLQDSYYPTCIDKISIYKKKQQTQNQQDLFKEGKQYLRMFNYYQENDILWNKQFLDEECQFDPILLQGKFCNLE